MVGETGRERLAFCACDVGVSRLRVGILLGSLSSSLHLLTFVSVYCNFTKVLHLSSNFVFATSILLQIVTLFETV